MTTQLQFNPAFGHPGIPPRWTRSDKDGVGTAYSASSPIWFTVSAGILNEVYFPTIDRPQIRDLQFLVTDGESFFHDERRHLLTKTERICNDSLGFRITNRDPDGRYEIIKEIIAAPHAACVLIHVQFLVAQEWRDKLKLYVLLAPHLDVGGWGNDAHVATIKERKFLVAEKNSDHLALGATCPFSHASCGYVGSSDGWQDLHEDFHLDWEFDSATDGNLAMIAEVEMSRNAFESGSGEPRANARRRMVADFTLGLALSHHMHGAITTLQQSLAIPFADHLKKFQAQWRRATDDAVDLTEASGDGGELYRVSHRLLLAHEDKQYHGAMIASLSIPWGEARGDDDLGGYHLVWTRDMVNSATGLMAAGNLVTPFRALVYLACAQRDDGGFHQNFWIDGDPYWTGVQLDEVAFPILLAWKLDQADALENFDPYPMVKAAAGYLIREGPVTPQERWEENSGYSPSTLASNIAALTCAAQFANQRGDRELSVYLQEYADFLECHIEVWTVTNEGTLLADVPRHFIRLQPADPTDPIPHEDPNDGTLQIKNRAPDLPCQFPANEIVDAGFLELVRYGIRPADDPLIEDSIRVVDSVLKIETPNGPCWRRYNHDGYGQRSDGGPFNGWGQGRAWPLLAGERAHYEFAAGREVCGYVGAMESFASATGLLPEQVWDEPDRPELRMFLGHPTGSAMPLMWAHAEYIKLLRSIHDSEVFDRIVAVADRYLNRRDCRPLEIWKFNRQVQACASEHTLRIQAHSAFRLRVSNDQWSSYHDCDSAATSIGVFYCDVEPVDKRIDFTFYWPDGNRWEGRNFHVLAAASAGSQRKSLC